MKVNELTTFQRLASYVTKEKRSGGKGNGDRAYIPSLNLEQPVIDGHWCTEFEGIVLPQGAEEIKSGAERDEVFGSSMEYTFTACPGNPSSPSPTKARVRCIGSGAQPQRNNTVTRSIVFLGGGY